MSRTVHMWLALATLALANSGCVTRYAEVYVRAVDTAAGNTPLGDCRIISAADGTTLGDSLKSIRLRKPWFAQPPVLAIVVQHDIYAPAWTLFRVSKWAPTPLLAADAAYTNEVHVPMHPCR